MYSCALGPLIVLSLSAVVSAGVFRPPSKVSAPTQSSLTVQESHKCAGYCNGPTCGDVCSCSRFNFCFKGPSDGPDLYRIYNQPAGEATVYGQAVGVSNTTKDGPQVEWMLDSISGDTYQIVSKLLGAPVAYSNENPTWPLIVSNNKSIPNEWSIRPVKGNSGAFTIKLSGEEDLCWTAPGVGTTIELQGENAGNAQQWRITPLP
ncbi:hypothetical protein C8R43DRAFT_975012 [Mycena crocata]|nr:hypothetical protein C8R43DRAFT_975012 [Mycena crocata]